MALDPQAQAVIDLVIKSGRPAYNTLSPKDARQLFRETRPASTPPPPEIGAVRNPVPTGPGGPIPLRADLQAPGARLSGDRRGRRVALVSGLLRGLHAHPREHAVVHRALSRRRGPGERLAGVAAARVVARRAAAGARRHRGVRSTA